MWNDKGVQSLSSSCVLFIFCSVRLIERVTESEATNIFAKYSRNNSSGVLVKITVANYGRETGQIHD